MALLRLTAVGLIGLVLSFSAGANEPQSPRVNPGGAGADVRLMTDGGSTGLALGSAPAFHWTPNAVANVRVVPVGGSAIRLVLWTETAPGDVDQPMYAISLDGVDVQAVQPVSGVVRLRHGDFDPVVGEQPVVPELAADASTELYVVQFVTQPLEEYRVEIAALGSTVHNYLADQCHIVRMSSAVRDQVAALPYVRWVGPLHPAYRTEEFLLENRAQAAQFFPVHKYNVQVLESGLVQKNLVADRIRAIGGQVDRADAGKFLLEATLTSDQLFQVIRWNEVLFVDRWSPYDTDMNFGREIGGANYIETVAGFTGSGVRGEVIDVGFNVSHVDFASRPLIQHTAVSTNSHGASTSGIIFGDGTGNSQGRGLLPLGQGIIADYDVVNTGAPRYTHTGQLVQAPYFAVFQSASVGSSWTTQYTTISADTDAMLFDFDILHCQSQSNQGTQSSRPQAWAKNIVSVGAVRHYNTLTKSDDCWCSGASIGPAADGRLKPDLCHFYDSIYTVTTGSTTAYTSGFGGTSGATPIVAGHFGLFYQMWSQGIFGNPVNPSGTVFDNRPHMTTAKAMLINTASQYAFSGTAHDLTRTHQGWGMPDLKSLYDLRQKMLIINEADLLTNLATKTYTAIVSAGEPALRVTMTYADPPGVPNSSVHRVNDLSLKVTSPGGTVYWGNNGLAAGVWSTSGGVANTIDTVENVFVQNPAAGTWTFQVIASQLNQDGHVQTPALDADFALVASGVTPYAPPTITLPQPIPSPVPPDQVQVFAVTIENGTEAAVPSTATVNYRFDPQSSFTQAVMTHLGGSNYQASIPGAPCGAQPELYLRVQGTQGAVVLLPAQAPAATFNYAIGAPAAVVSDTFETVSGGWVVTSEPSTLGVWVQVDPVGTINAGQQAQPEDDHTPAPGVMCWVTGQGVPGGSPIAADVDGGPTRLMSPALVLGASNDPVIRYYRWFYTDGDDQLVVEISPNDGGTWFNVETVGNANSWIQRTVRIRDHFTPTDQVRIRFVAADVPNNSTTEAAIDDFEVIDVVCLTHLPGDLNCDNQVNLADIPAFALALVDPAGYGDLYGTCDIMRGDMNGDTQVNGLDVDGMVNALLP